MDKILQLVLLLVFVSCDASACFVTLREAGAVAHSQGDDTLAINRVLQTPCANNPSEHKVIEGENLTYFVNGDLVMDRDMTITLRNLRIVQNKTNASVRTIYKTGGTVYLYNVIVHRGESETTGDVNSNAGIWLQVNNSVLDTIEITGNGLGKGIMLVASNNVQMNNIYVHDMKWKVSTPPAHEQLIGIDIQQSTNITLTNSWVENLYGDMGNGIYTKKESDGITLGGVTGVKISNTVVKNTGEGIDFTGSLNNTNFEVVNSSVFDNHSFGFKFANLTSNGVIRNSSAYRAGIAGFVFSSINGQAEAGMLQTSDILVDNCKAFNTAHNSEWGPSWYKAGFYVLRGADGIHPKNIHIRNSLASNDSEHLNIMTHGFLSETLGNSVYNTDSIGHTIEGSAGFVLGTP